MQEPQSRCSATSGISGTPAPSAEFSRRTLLLFFAGTILLAMLTTAFHPYLWGPDEPREAEIAREIYESGNYVTPRLCALPFVEKPPLYYDIVAGVFHLTGPSPSAARIISALFGCLMLLTVYLIGTKARGRRCGFFALLLLLFMPQFYRAAHWILLDIQLGALCTAALGLFAWFEFFGGERFRRWIWAGFWLTCAGIFLTKGVFGLFTTGLVIGAYILIRRRWNLIGEILFQWGILLFLIPVGIWLWAFWREGGIYYLHEHFINNIFGRLLHREFKLPGSPLFLTDVGGKSPWYFYLGRAPVMFGAVLPLGLFGIYDALRVCGGLPAKLRGFGKNDPAEISRGRKILRFLLNGTGRDETLDSETNRAWSLFLLLAFALPIAVLSFSAQKEVTYLLPSYAALALLCAEGIHARLPEQTTFSAVFTAGIALLLTVSLLAGAVAPFSPLGYLIAAGLLIAGSAFLSLRWIFGKTPKREAAIALLLSAGICGIMIGNTPSVMRKSRLNRKCLIEAAAETWKSVGSRKLYLFQGEETFRGSIPFYGNRTTPALASPDQLFKVMEKEPESCIMLVEPTYRRLLKDPQFQNLDKTRRKQEIRREKMFEDFILLLPESKK